MLYLTQLVQRFKNDEKGQALTEYGLIIALVGVALVAALIVLKGDLQGIFEGISTAITP